jgi:hypothetical protein
MGLPPRTGGGVGPAFARLATISQSQQFLGILRALGRIFLEAGQHRIVELAWNRQLAALGRRHGLVWT